MTTEANPTPAEPTPGTPPVAAPTPPVEPVQLDLNAAPAPVAPPVAPPPAEPAPATFDPTGDPKMDIALAFFAKAGLKPEDAAVTAAQKGDFTLLKATLAAKGSTGWQEHVALAEQSFQEVSAAAKEKGDKTQAAVLSVFDTPEQWGVVRQWAADNADDSEREQINAMFAAGPVAAKAAAVYLRAMYDKAGQVLERTAPPAVADTRGSAPPQAGATLTKQQFAAAVQDLVRTKGSRVVDEQHPEYLALVRRRQAHRD